MNEKVGKCQSWRMSGLARVGVRFLRIPDWDVGEKKGRKKESRNLRSCLSAGELCASPLWDPPHVRAP